jgi:hypothetical protein
MSNDKLSQRFAKNPSVKKVIDNLDSTVKKHDEWLADFHKRTGGKYLPKKPEVKEEASPMIKPPKNHFDSKADAFAHAKKSFFTHPTTGQKNVHYFVKPTMSEESEMSKKTLSELRKTTLASYIGKANDDAVNTAMKAGAMTPGTGSLRSKLMKMGKRSLGIQQAARKLANEEKKHDDYKVGDTVSHKHQGMETHGFKINKIEGDMLHLHKKPLDPAEDEIHTVVNKKQVWKEEVEQIEESYDKSSKAHEHAKKMASMFKKYSKAKYNADGSATIQAKGSDKFSSVNVVDNIHKESGHVHNRSAEDYKNSKSSKGGLTLHTKEIKPVSNYKGGHHEIHISADASVKEGVEQVEEGSLGKAILNKGNPDGSYDHWKKEVKPVYSKHGVSPQFAKAVDSHIKKFGHAIHVYTFHGDDEGNVPDWYDRKNKKVKPLKKGKSGYTVEEVEQVEESSHEGSTPKTAKEKALAAHHGNPNKITYGDVVKARIKSAAKKK